MHFLTSPATPALWLLQEFADGEVYMPGDALLEA